MPTLPVALDDAGTLMSTVPPTEDKHYQRIAADLRGAIMCGALKPGDKLPAFVDLAARYDVAFNTAQRAVAELKSAGLVSVSRGRRAVVADPSAASQTKAEVVSLDARKRAAT
jgi:DNA-binding GntR family transcriptional regulator